MAAARPFRYHQPWLLVSWRVAARQVHMQGVGAASNAGSFPADLPGGRGALFALALSVIPLAVAVAFFLPEMQRGWPARTYLGVHLAIETMVAVVAFATFAVQWHAAGAQLNDARARFVGAAFLAVALFQVMHLLAFPGMPGFPWLESSTERGIVYWLSARLCGVGALLAALAVPPESEAPLLRRGPLLASALGVVAVVLAVDYLWISRQPLFFVEGQGLTPLKKVLEFVVAGAAAVGVVAYRRAASERRDRSSDHLVLALGLTVLSELCFTLYARAFDSFNLLGHVYLLLASHRVFRALFIDAVLRPYERLGVTSRALAASNEELRRLQEHVEGKLAVTIRNLETLQEQREDLVRAVSHDLRSPLQTVLLQAERLARGTTDGTRERGAAEAIGRAGRQMNALIGDLLESVHLESGTVQLSKEPIAVGDFVRDLLAVGGGAGDGERLEIEIPADLPPVPADPLRMARVVQNLVGNALKYSAPGTRVVIGARRAAGEVVVTVADGGEGIPPQDLPRIFERFFRGAQGGRSSGLGLGLYSSRLIVEAHGGRIWCESVVGEGSRFSFALPLAR
jgi:signal transduction histidine kinase